MTRSLYARCNKLLGSSAESVTLITLLGTDTDFEPLDSRASDAERSLLRVYLWDIYTGASVGTRRGARVRAGPGGCFPGPPLLHAGLSRRTVGPYSTQAPALFLHHVPVLIGPVLRIYLEAVQDRLKARSGFATHIPG